MINLQGVMKDAFTWYLVFDTWYFLNCIKLTAANMINAGIWARVTILAPPHDWPLHHRHSKQQNNQKNLPEQFTYLTNTLLLLPNYISKRGSRASLYACFMPIYLLKNFRKRNYRKSIKIFRKKIKIDNA